MIQIVQGASRTPSCARRPVTLTALQEVLTGSEDGDGVNFGQFAFFSPR